MHTAQEIINEPTIIGGAVETPETSQELSERSQIVRRVQEHKAIWLPTSAETLETVLVHESASIGQRVQAGKGGGPVGKKSVVGDDVMLEGALFTNVHVGDRTIIGPNARIGDVGKEMKTVLGKIIIGSDAIIDASARIHSPAKGKTTEIGENAHIGARVQIGEKKQKNHMLRPVTIGSKALIANGVIIRCGVSIGEKTEIHEGYEIAPGVKIPAGIRVLRDTTSRLRGRQVITKSWLKEHKHLIEEVE